MPEALVSRSLVVFSSACGLVYMLYTYVLSGHGSFDNRVGCCFAFCLPPAPGGIGAKLQWFIALWTCILIPRACVLDVLISPRPRCKPMGCVRTVTLCHKRAKYVYIYMCAYCTHTHGDTQLQRKTGISSALAAVCTH